MADRRLLAISAVSPGEARNGYALRVQQLLAELGNEWSIALIAPGIRDGVQGVAEVREVPARGGFVPTTPRHDAHDARLRAEVEQVAAAWQPDALLVWPGSEHVVLDSPRLPPALADRIDCWTLTVWRHLRLARAPRAIASGLRELALGARFERRIVRGLAAASVVGPGDARWLERIGGRPVDVIPNGVALGAAGTAADEAPEPTVAFTGVLNYAPNVDAALFLARSIWPRVRAAVPSARLILAGQSPTPEVSALAAQPGVEVHADVPDMAALLRRSWLAAAPMQSGAGIKNKVLEAWAVGRPVVLTPIAANGLDLDAGTAAWIAADAGEAARKIVQLLSSPQERARAGAHARAVAATRHSWRDAAQRLSARLHSISAAPLSGVPGVC